MTTHIRARSLAALVALLAFAAPAIAVAAINPIQNPSFTTPSAGNANVPDKWSLGGYDTTYTAFYPVASATTSDARAAKISITACAATCGDAKWIFEPVAASGGALYTFTDQYSATVPSSLVAAFNHADGSTTYLPISNTLPATGAAWTNASVNFTVPASASPVTTMTVYHLISSIGSITTDNYSVAEATQANENLLPHGVVSLSFDDGWDSQYTNAFPSMLANGLVGTFYVMSHTTQDSSAHELFADAGATADMQVATASTSKSWSGLYTDPSSPNYFFSDTYTSSAASTITVGYKVSGVATSSVRTFPAGTNAKAEFQIELPAVIDAGSFSVTHSSSAALSISGTPTLYELIDSYMAARQIQILKAAGNEIGSHTQDHCNLATLETTNGADTASCAHLPGGPTSANLQIVNSKTEVQAILGGGSIISSLAYPYGAFSAGIEQLLANAGFSTGRSTINGYNTLATDPRALQVQTVDATTSYATVKGWIDTAVSNHYWLILLFHQVDNPVTMANGSEDGGTTPQIFSQIASYLKAQNVDVKTVGDEYAYITSHPVVYSIAVSAGTNGTITPGTTDVVAGGSRTFAIAADTGYHLDTLTVDGGVMTPAASYTFSNVHAAHSISATFAANPGGASTYHSITASAGAGGSISPSGMVSIPDGSGQAYTITANSGYSIKDVLVDNVSIGAVSSKVFSANNANHTIAATFSQNSSGGGNSGGSSGSGSGGSSGGSSGSGSGGTATSTGGSVLGAATYNFKKDLFLGSSGTDVTELQKVLVKEGFLKVAPTGYFGTATLAAVISYQKAHKITPAAGYVGAKTRAVLNQAAPKPLALVLTRDQIVAKINELLALLALNQKTRTAAATFAP